MEAGVDFAQRQEVNALTDTIWGELIAVQEVHPVSGLPLLLDAADLIERHVRAIGHAGQVIRRLRVLHTAIGSWKPGFADLAGGVGKLRDAAERVTQTPPTVIPVVEECAYCINGQVNIGTAVDPEPGPCPRCSCELHQEPHADCLVELRNALQAGSVLTEGRRPK